MRVLFVDHEVRLSGGERDLVDLAAALAPLDLDLHVALPGDGPLADALRREGVEIHVVPMGAELRRVSRWDLARRPWVAGRHLAAAARSSRALRWLVRRLEPDIVHTNSLKAHLLAIPATRSSPAPHVWHVRDILEDGWLRRAFAQAAARAADRVLVLSSAAAQQFVGTPAAPIVSVVHNGIRPRVAVPEAAARLRARLTGGDDGPLIGMVGQIAAWKGQDVFVEAAEKVVGRRPGARFAVVGECLFPQNEADFERRTRHHAATGPLRDRLVWAGPIEPIEPVMAACDVIVHASRLPEPFGRVIVEAMAQGTPVVTTDVGAGRELMGADAGVVVPAGDPDSLATALVGLIDDPPVLARMGGAARARAERFTISRTADAVLRVYADLGVPSPAGTKGA